MSQLEVAFGTQTRYDRDTLTMLPVGTGASVARNIIGPGIAPKPHCIPPPPLSAIRMPTAFVVSTRKVPLGTAALALGWLWSTNEKASPPAVAELLIYLCEKVRFHVASVPTLI